MSDNTFAESELFFTILRYLKSFDNLKDLTNELEDRIAETGKFGNIVAWDGSERTSTLKDFEKKYPLITSDHLPTLLSKAISTIPTSSKSLLRAITGFYNFSDATQFSNFTTKSSELSNLLSSLREKKKRIDSLSFRRANLNEKDFLESRKLLLEDIDLTENNFEAENPDWKETRMILTEADRTRQIQKITGELAALDISLKDESELKQKTVQDLRNSGCLLSGVHRGHLDCGLDWLMHRSLNSRTSNFASFQSLSSSASALKRRFLTKYRHLYTVSGHSYNPVYCSAFDLTGNFLITGADDFLVKIWDVRKGQLIKTCRGHKNYITLIVVSPDNSLFASACTGGTIRIWKMPDGVCQLVLHHNAPVNWLKFDPATGNLASVGDDGFAMVWDLSKLLDLESAGSPLLQETANRQIKKTNSSSNIQISPSPSGPVIDESERGIQVNQSSSDFPLTHFPSPVRRFSTPTRDAILSGNEEALAKAIIGLPHLHDFQVSSLENENKKVISLDISPVGNILVTGCDDGVVRIWRLSNSNRFHMKGRFQDLKARLPRMKQDLAHNDYLKFERLANYLLLKLEGHLNPVTDIQINSLGDRILTASTLDGSVRIWSLNSDVTESVHIVLVLADDDMEEARPASIRVRGRNSSANKSKIGIQVYNVCWTCDDAKVVTIFSVPNPNSTPTSNCDITRLKVWHSITGQLLHMIKNISDVASRCLCRHPSDPTILATGGEDGILNVWNIVEETNILKHKLTIESLEHPGTFVPVNIVDISFTADGSHIATTDIVGRFSFFGLEDPDRFANVLSEQYFSSDYNEIMHDNEGNALDIGTQLPVHLAPVGLLTRIDGAVHEVQPIIQSHPEVFSLQEVKQHLKRVHDDIRTLLREQERMFRTFQRIKHTGFQSNSFIGIRKAKESPGSSSKPSISRPFSYRPRQFNYVEFDVEHYQPSSGEESYDSDWNGEEVGPDEEGSGNSDDFGSEEDDGDNGYVGKSDDSEVMATRRSRRKIIEKKKKKELKEIEAKRAKQAKRSKKDSSGLRRSRRHRTYVASYDDAYDEDDLVSFPSPEAVRHARMKAKKQKKAYLDGVDLSQFIEEDEDDEVDFDDHDSRDAKEEEWNAFSDSSDRHRQKKTRGRPKNSSSSQQPPSHKQTKQRNKPVNLNKISRARRNQLPEMYEIGLKLDRTWLQSFTPHESLYAPQIGDHVIYFPQGHKEQLQRFTEDVSPPWNSFPQKWPLVECIVRDVTYRFPNDQELRWCNSMIAEVSLAIVGTPSRYNIAVTGQYMVSFVPPRSTRHNAREQLITVTLRNTQLPDFLVLFEIFQRTIRVAWHQGVKISVAYKEIDPENGEVIFKEYPGKVVSLSNSDPEWPYSPWEALEVTWDDNTSSSTVDRINPWEAKAVFSSSSHSLPIGSKFDGNERIRILEELEKLIESSQLKFEPFQYEVDSSVYPEYYCLIALPMYLELIVKRLQNGYYRQIEALIADVNLLYQNCLQFNSETAEIVLIAEELKSDMMKIIYPNPLLPALDSSQPFSNENENGNEHENGRADTRGRRSKSNRQLGNEEEVPFSPENQEDDLFDPQSLEKDPLIIRFKRKRGHSSEDESQNAPRKSSRLTSEGYGYFESPVDPSPIAPRRGRPPRTAPAPVVELVDSSPEKLMIPLRGRGRPAKNSKRSKEEDEDEDDDDDDDDDDGSSAFSANSDGDEDADSDDQEEEDDDDDADDNDDDSDDRPRRSSRKRKPTTAAKRGGRKKKLKKAAPKAKTSSSRVTRGRGRRSHQENDEDEDEEEDELPSSPEVVQKQTRRTSARSQRYTEEADEVESVDRGRSSNTRRSTRQRRSINYDEEDEGQSAAVEPQQGEDEDEEQEEVPQSRRGRTIKPPSNILKEIYEKEKEEKEERQRQKQKEERQSNKHPVSSSSSQLHNLELSTTRKRIDPETKHTLQLIIQKAEELDGDYQFFALPVDPSVAIGYYQIIQQPMDLSTIRTKLSTREYQSAQEMISDVLLMYENCILYNRDDSIYTKEAKKQKRKFLTFLMNEQIPYSTD